MDSTLVKTDGTARGLNALQFSYDGTVAQRLAGPAAGSFQVSTGGTKSYSDLLVLVAIDATSLPSNFSLTMGGRTFDNANDFASYDPAAAGYSAGRPGGYYSATNPTSEPLAYDFDKGMVTIMALPGFGPSSPATVDYAFEGLPGKAVFSIYTKVEGAAFIYHTNRGVADNNLAGSVNSTFEVVPEPGTSAMLILGLAALRRRKHPCRAS